MIPQFPQFKILELSDKEEVEKFTNYFEPYSDFNFTSLWTYNIQENFELSNLDGNLIVKMIDYNTFDPIFTFIGKHQVDRNFERLFSYLHSIRKKEEIHLVPESVIHLLHKQKKFIVVEDIDNHDYILSINDHISLEGKKFHKRRNLVKRFLREYENRYVINKVNFADKNELKSFSKVFEKWQQSRNKEKDESDHEFTYLERLFKSVHMLNVEAILLFVNDNPAGFCVYEPLTHHQGVIHFEKADVQYVGIFEFLTHQTAKNLKDLHCEYINYEQDLGSPGLRNTKILHRPVRFLKKYKVYPHKSS